jgi:hypothetical protein
MSMNQDHDDDARKRTDTREQDVTDDVAEDTGEGIGGGEEDTDTETVHHGEIVSADEDDRANRAIAINGGDSDEVESLYADYEPEEAEELRQAVTEAKAVINTSAAEMGRALMRVKALVRHGNWEKWVALEFNMSKRSAQNLISLATVANTALENFGHTGESKVLALPQTVNYQIGDRHVPPDDQAYIVDRVVHGEFASEDEILDAVRDAKERAKAERRSTKGSTDDDGSTRAKAKADEPKETAAERKKKLADAMRRDSAYQLALCVVLDGDTDNEGERTDIAQILSHYSDIGSGPKKKMTDEDHAMVSKTLFNVADAYMKSGMEAVEALKPVIPAEPVTKKSKAAVGGDD